MSETKIIEYPGYGLEIYVHLYINILYRIYRCKQYIVIYILHRMLIRKFQRISKQQTNLHRNYK